MNRSVLSLSLWILAAVGFGLASAGCAGQGVNFSPWVGSYTGTGTLDNGKNGTLALSSNASGIVGGTFVVTGTDGTDKNFKFTPGTYTVSGSITSTTGGFEVIGNVPNNGSFFVRGSFPTDNSSKPYSVVTGTSSTFPTSQLYNGNLIKN